MAHSVKNHRKKEKKMGKLRRRVVRLSKLASRQIEQVDEMTLPYVALGDLRRRWRQRETLLHSALLNKFDKFKRIKMEKNKPLRISYLRIRWWSIGIWCSIERERIS